MNHGLQLDPRYARAAKGARRLIHIVIYMQNIFM
jgi:hypothetical protein